MTARPDDTETAAAAPWSPETVEVGGWKITALTDGGLRLDGGSMWGVVPANIWRRLTPPAEDNTIQLALRPFLAQRDGANVVIEVGVGGRWSDKWRSIYHIERDTTLLEALAACGVEAREVTHVVASHCHWDHVGAQVLGEDGALRPAFPRARHYAPAIEVEMAKHPGHARSGSYRAEDVLPIEEAGLLEVYSAEREILPGLTVHPLGGHSDGVSVITFGGGGADTAIFWSDVVPTTHHIQPPYIMAYDIDVVRSFEVRSEWLERAAAAGWTGLFYHDQDVAFARVVRGERRFELAPLTGDAG